MFPRVAKTLGLTLLILRLLPESPASMLELDRLKIFTNTRFRGFYVFSKEEGLGELKTKAFFNDSENLPQRVLGAQEGPTP